MKVILQRVSHASVTIEGNCHGKINQGLLLLVGISYDDTKETVLKVAKKCAELRIFEDENGKMNKGLLEVQGSILSISQFTLYADCKKGRRPSFDKAAKGDIANPLYEYFNEVLKEYGIQVETGVFGADMKVELCNDGPVSIILDSAEL
ncbi:MAG: D-aminoacyl-tRNA deacylase [Longicatena sp.]